MAAKLGGVKGGKYSLGQNADINVTPFVDVMLVLLIIFMVSIPAATVAIKIDLPPAVNTPDTPKEKPTYISIQQDGKILDRRHPDHPGQPAGRPDQGAEEAQPQG